VEIIGYEPPEAFGALPEVIPLLMAREAVRIHGELLDRHGDALGVKLAALLERGRAMSDGDYTTFRAVIAEARSAYAALTAEHPVVLTPAALGPAPRGLSSTGDPRCNAPWTALGVPAIGFPLGTAPSGLPLGLQLTAAAGGESLLLATAAVFERVLRAPDAVIGSD
jgi:Asp-tRNA(Asn)/Glu-tRNA(Gln) amidotransferase A subunit family amidase